MRMHGGAYFRIVVIHIFGIYVYVRFYRRTSHSTNVYTHMCVRHPKVEKANSHIIYRIPGKITRPQRAVRAH